MGPALQQDGQGKENPRPRRRSIEILEGNLEEIPKGEIEEHPEASSESARRRGAVILFTFDNVILVFLFPLLYTAFDPFLTTEK